MTFCLTMKVEEGLVGIADTRVTSGAEAITASKVSVNHGPHSMFLMTSGLRSVRDKALTYFEEALERTDLRFDRLYKAVNAFAEQLRRVADEDKRALAEANLPFDLFTLVGGQLKGDKEHKLYLLYPQANWVEVSPATPYFLIGESGYAKPLLDRVLAYETPLETALKIGIVAFDSTRRSATNVDFPIDIVIYRPGTYRMVEHRFEEADLSGVSEWWTGNLRTLIEGLPSGWVEAVLNKGESKVTPIIRPSLEH
jgi:putative proteasome-type protease